MKVTNIHMQDNDSTAASETSSQHPNITPQTSGASTPNTTEQDYMHAFDHTLLDEDYFDERPPRYQPGDHDPAKPQPGDHDHAKPQPEDHDSANPQPDATDADSAFCAILPQRRAVLVEEKSKIKLSALVAAVLIEAKILEPRNLSLYPPRSRTPPNVPTDPISGIISAAHGTVGGVLMGVADYPIEITKMAKADRDVVAGLATDFALDSGKGVSRIIGTGLKAPMDITLNISRGFGNLPELCGDDTVRKEETVTGITSGLGAAGKGLGLGLYDGITGLVTQPYNGAKKGGLGGFFGGFGKGLVGVVCKPVAGAVGLPAYAFKGVYEGVQNLQEDRLKSSLLADGTSESKKTVVADRLLIFERWFELV